MFANLSRRVAGPLLALTLLAVAPQAVRAADELTDAKLQSFATAVLAVNDVVQKWQPQIQQAGDEQQKQAMAVQANGEMQTAVEQTQGITVDEYQNIIQLAQNDQGLRDRIDGLLSKMVQK